MNANFSQIGQILMVFLTFGDDFQLILENLYTKVNFKRNFILGNVLDPILDFMGPHSQDFMHRRGQNLKRTTARL